MTTTLSRQEIATISLQLRRHCSEVMETVIEDKKVYLQRLMEFIDNTPVLHEYIQGLPKVDLEAMLKDHNWMRRLPVPTIVEEQITFTYQLLHDILVVKPEYYSFCYGYGNTKSINEHLAEFNRQVVQRFVSYLNQYLETIMAQLPHEPSSLPAFTVQQVIGNNNVVNSAQGNSSIINSSAVGETDEIITLLSQVIPLIREADVPTERKEEAVELAEGIGEQLQSEKPKASVVKRCVEGLKDFSALITAGTVLGGKLGEVIANISMWLNNLRG